MANRSGPKTRFKDRYAVHLEPYYGKRGDTIIIHDSPRYYQL